jgi:thiol-disulfide isomerase/thioredoxin
MRLRHPLAAVALLLASAAAFAQEVPRPSGEFAMGNGHGAQYLLSHYSGKVVVLAFMYTTCPHCQHTTQILSGIQAEYADRGLQILGAFFNPNADQLLMDFIARFHPAFPVGFAERDQVNEFLHHPLGKPTYVPEVVFIDRNRVIRAQYSGEVDFFKDQEKNIREMVDSLLKEPVASKKNGRSAHKKS